MSSNVMFYNNNEASQSVTQIGKYEILEFVGSGGLAKVYKARDPSDGSIVALKRLHDHYQRDQKLLGLFHKEIMIHSQVSHKHCVQYLEANLTPPNAHFVTEFIDGYNTYNLIRQVGAVPPLITCCIILDLLKGLEHLHCLDIVHSDMTPSNVMLERTGRVVLADFGLSCHQEFENYEGQTVGTPGYQAPERLSHAAITPAADIYGAGIIMYELMHGERLFHGVTGKELTDRMKNIEVDWIKTGDKTLDKSLKEILRTALAYRPAKRYETPFHFMEALYYKCLKPFKVSYTRRANLQWMVDNALTTHPLALPKQEIYLGKQDSNHSMVPKA